jgi:hypothetical protein
MPSARRGEAASRTSTLPPQEHLQCEPRYPDAPHPRSPEQPDEGPLDQAPPHGQHPLSGLGRGLPLPAHKKCHSIGNDSPPRRIDPTPAPPTRARQLGRGATTSLASRSDPPPSIGGACLARTQEVSAHPERPPESRVAAMSLSPRNRGALGHGSATLNPRVGSALPSAAQVPAPQR